MKLQVRAHELADAIKSGRGSGIGDQYLPWIEVKRSNTSPYSNQCHWRMPGEDRLGHYLSRGERNVALLLSWLGVEQVREQYPLWGWPHPHPADQIDGEGTHAPHVGLERVAADAGIQTWRYPGTSIPIVLTIDMMVTIRPKHSNHAELVGVSCKPRRGPGNGPHSLRVLERLELDRRYCKAGGMRHLLVHPEAFPHDLIASLIWIAPTSTRAEYRAIRRGEKYARFLPFARKQVYLRPAFRVVDDFARDVGLDASLVAEILKIAIWTQDLDVDVDRRLNFAQPLSPGGLVTRRRLADLFFGGLKNA